jgi:hypothetical protein
VTAGETKKMTGGGGGGGGGVIAQNSYFVAFWSFVEKNSRLDPRKF